MCANLNIPSIQSRLKVVYSPAELPRQNWLQIARVYWRMARLMGTTLRQRNVTLAQFEILAILAAGEGISQQELAEHMLVTKGNVCTVLTRMEEAGLIRRKPDLRDGRAKNLFLTNTGRSLFAQLGPLVDRSIQDVFGNLSLTNQQGIQESLDQLERGLMEKGYSTAGLNPETEI